MADAPRYFLKLTCDDRPGIVAAVSDCIASNQGNILESAQFDDPETGKFLMRIHFSTPAIEGVEFQLKPIIQKFDIRSELIPEAHVGRVLILVSKMDHCLHDLLYRWRKREIRMDVAGVVSNHKDTRDLVQFYGLPYHHLPVTNETRAEQEAQIMDLITKERVDLVILARYMQVLSPEFADKLYAKAINIHHSFLPSFKGARPYERAHTRGVKLTGATAHYVTPELDDGPIIEQEVARIRHSDTVADLVRIGRNTEARVLARAVGWHLEHRVFINGGKTVVFS